MGICLQSQPSANGGTIQVKLTFLRKELLYDIANVSFVVGDTMSEDAQHARHQLQDIVERGNVDRVTRMLDLAHAECVEELYAYTKTAVVDETLDDKLQEREAYEIHLALPKQMSMSTARLLEHYIHDYMVCKVLGDWLNLVAPPNGGSIWLARLDDLLEKIRSSVSQRRQFTKRKLQPW